MTADAARLWDWQIKVHGGAGVDAALIALQDQHGQCVSYLLWAAWTASEGRRPAPAALAEGAALARRWEAEVTGPLRIVRRALKPAWTGVDDAGREALRSHVKASEMDAEHRLSDALAALPSRPQAAWPLAAALEEASAAWAPDPPGPALTALAQMFQGLDV